MTSSTIISFQHHIVHMTMISLSSIHVSIHTWTWARGRTNPPCASCTAGPSLSPTRGWPIESHRSCGIGFLELLLLGLVGLVGSESGEEGFKSSDFLLLSIEMVLLGFVERELSLEFTR